MTAPQKKPPSCEGCKYWTRYSIDDFDWSDGKANPDDFGKCAAVQFDFWQSKGNHPFYVMDGSRYKAELSTRRDFCCNQHEVGK
jgi:hypothetical protein